MIENDQLAIVLIEDDPGDRRLAEIALRESVLDGRFRIELQSATTLAEGLALLGSAANRPDAVLFDLSLPDAVGLDGLRTLSNACPDVAIVVLTGRFSLEAATEALRIGASDYLEKADIQPHGLLRSICYAIERKKDIVQRGRIENALRESESRLRGFLLAGPDAMVIVDQTGDIILASRRAETMFGYAPGELVGGSINMLVPERHRDLHAAHLGAYMQAPAGRRMAAERTLYASRKDGSEFPVEVSLSPDRAAGGLFTIAAVRDISDRKAIESQLRQAQKMEAIGNLTGGMAHDFNNLLGVIIGNLDLLAARPHADADSHALASEALDAALRGADLIRRLLAFARRQPLKPQQVDVDDTVERIGELVRHTLGGNIKITLALADRIAPIVADPAQLEASLLNIINNACDAMPGGGALTITTANRYLDKNIFASRPELAPGYYSVIELSDTGSGMPPEVIGRIFEPFFTTKDPGKGTGLGLSMVFGFVKQSGGHIDVYSEIGIGTAFRLYLPSIVTQTESRPRTQAAYDPELGRLETVLVVEDTANLRLLVTRQLKELGYRFLEAEDGSAALKILERDSIDLLFSDVLMPGGMSGYDLARTVAARWPAIKVVLTSGLADARPDVNRKPPTTSNMRLLVKPYRKSDLARILREVLDS